MKVLFFAIVLFIGAIFGHHDKERRQLYCDCLNITYTELFANKVIEAEVQKCQQLYPSSADFIEDAFIPVNNKIIKNVELFNSVEDCKDWENLTPNLREVKGLIADFGRDIKHHDIQVYDECIHPITYSTDVALADALNNCTQYKKHRC